MKTTMITTDIYLHTLKYKRYQLSTQVVRVMRVLPLGPPLKFFIDYNKTILGAAPPRVTRNPAFMPGVTLRS